MTKTLTAVQSDRARLEAERVRLSEALAEALAEAKTVADSLEFAFAVAARHGTGEIEASGLEHRRDELDSAARRLRAGIAQVDRELSETATAEDQAARAEREARLAEIRDQAAKLANTIERKAFDAPREWEQLELLYTEHRGIVRELTGVDALGHVPNHPLAWREPAAAFLWRIDTLCRGAFGVRLGKLAGDGRLEIATFTPAPSFRVALGLD